MSYNQIHNFHYRSYFISLEEISDQYVCHGGILMLSFDYHFQWLNFLQKCLLYQMVFGKNSQFLWLSKKKCSVAKYFSDFQFSEQKSTKILGLKMCNSLFTNRLPALNGCLTVLKRELLEVLLLNTVHRDFFSPSPRMGIESHRNEGFFSLWIFWTKTTKPRFLLSFQES